MVKSRKEYKIQLIQWFSEPDRNKNELVQTFQHCGWASCSFWLAGLRAVLHFQLRKRGATPISTSGNMVLDQAEPIPRHTKTRLAPRFRGHMIRCFKPHASSHV